MTSLYLRKVTIFDFRLMLLITSAVALSKLIVSASTLLGSVFTLYSADSRIFRGLDLYWLLVFSLLGT